MSPWSASVSESSPPEKALELWLSPLSRVVLEGLRESAPIGEAGRSSEVPWWPSLKIWIVSVAEETQSSVDVILKDMLKIRDGIEPLRNWYSFWASGTENTRMIVPLSEAVANRVPSVFIARHDNGDLWASTTLIASSFSVSKIRTSPLVGEMWVLLGGACEGGVKDEGGAFCGRG